MWWAYNQGHHLIMRDLEEFYEASGLKFSLDTPAVCNRLDFTLKSGHCEVCLADIGEKYHRCESCLGGHFVICVYCYNLGARCLKGSHTL
ncbi:hypothetical protein BKA67DRAFT_581449, partial [Truncatella angustata]